MPERPRVIVGMSGGVDSAVTAYLLKLAGYDVIGVTLRTWIAADGGESRCCEISDAQKIADYLEIPYYVRSCLSEFRSCVTEPFVRDYLRGETPNPCVNCNRAVKWAQLLETARVMQAQYIATGHYASVARRENGRFTVQQAAHSAKDQTYMLWKLTQEQLRAAIMPLGKLTKDEARKIAADAGIPAANKPDSQEICFVTEGTYADFIAQNAAEPLPEAGNFVDTEGRVIGRHQGIYHYTIGQRRGLGLALGYPAYVCGIRAAENEVVIGPEEALYTQTLHCCELNFLGIPPMQTGETLRADVRIRYHHKAQPALLTLVAPDLMRIDFDTPVRAAAPGQSAVFYDAKKYLLGGGIIQ